MKKLFVLLFFASSFSYGQSLQNAIKLTDSEQYTLAEKELKDLEKQLIVYKTKCEIYQEKLDVK